MGHLPPHAKPTRGLGPSLGSVAVLLAAAVACESAGVQRAYMALDGNGDRKRTTFFTDSQAIWCDVDYSSGRKDLSIDVKLSASLLYDPARGAPVPVDVVIAHGEVTGQEGVGTTAGFQWKQVDATGTAAAAGSRPFPVGEFVCDVALDGELRASLPFSVVFPACPIAPVAGGVVCAGWVAPGSVCPDAAGARCTCAAGVWTC